MGGEYVYKVETHMHTSQGSACAHSTGAEMARAYKEQGYSAVIVTDHFFGGNTAVPSRSERTGDWYSWDKRLSLFAEGYEDAKREGDRIGLGVFFGFELGEYGTDFLIYDYGVERLSAFPSITAVGIHAALERIRGEGGFIVHAHPFRGDSYIRYPGRLFPGHIDAVEVINISNGTEETERLAVEYAERNGLIRLGGSDAHSAKPYGRGSGRGGVAFMERPKTINDVIRLARKGEMIILGE